MSRMGLSFCFARMKKNGWSLFQRIIPIHMDLLASLSIPRGPQPVRCTSKEHTLPPTVEVELAICRRPDCRTSSLD